MHVMTYKIVIIGFWQIAQRLVGRSHRKRLNLHAELRRSGVALIVDLFDIHFKEFPFVQLRRAVRYTDPPKIPR